MPCRLPVDLHIVQGILLYGRQVFPMAKSFNYRKYYKDYYGIDFGKEFDIHHIDINRENNEINNLILLPKRLHLKYHYSLSGLYRVSENDGLMKIYLIPYAFDDIEEYLEIAHQMESWANFKHTLDTLLKSGVKKHEIRDIVGFGKYFLPEGISWK